jgi:hypothetical protein
MCFDVIDQIFSHAFVLLQFGTHVSENHKLIAQPGVYLAHLGDVDVCMFSDRRQAKK